MAKQEELKNKVAGAGSMDIVTLIKQSAAELGKALPSHMNAERIVRIALTTLRTTPDLYKCTPQSILAALFQSAQLGLEPNIEGQAYIIPYNNKRKIGNEWKTVKEAQFQIGYKGYVELFYRHQSSLSLQMDRVCKGDDFDYAMGTTPYLKHKPAISGRGEPYAYYAVATLKDGASVFKIMSKEDCMAHGMQFSKCYSKKDEKFYDSTPWATNPDSMCMKTVLVQLMKLLPKSIEIQRALNMDETVKTKIDVDMTAITDEAVWEEKPEQIEEKTGEELKPSETQEDGEGKVIGK